jgi:hypothetical protein
MSNFQTEMNHAVEGFVAQIAELARRAALDTLASAFHGQRSRSRGTPALAGLAPRNRGGRPPGLRGVKRTPADLQALSDKFTAFVKLNPGLRIEQINKQLGTTTKDLTLPIRKLISDGAISIKGHKRSTTYFAGKKAKG